MKGLKREEKEMNGLKKEEMNGLKKEEMKCLKREEIVKSRPISRPFASFEAAHSLKNRTQPFFPLLEVYPKPRKIGWEIESPKNKHEESAFSILPITRPAPSSHTHLPVAACQTSLTPPTLFPTHLRNSDVLSDSRGEMEPLTGSEEVNVCTSFYQSKNFSAVRLLVAAFFTVLVQWILRHSTLPMSSISSAMPGKGSKMPLGPLMGPIVHPISSLAFFALLSLSWIGSARCAASRWTSQLDFDFSVYLALSTLAICLLARAKWLVPLIFSLGALFLFSCYITLSMPRKIEASAGAPLPDADLAQVEEGGRRKKSSDRESNNNDGLLFLPFGDAAAARMNPLGWVSIGALTTCTLSVGVLLIFAIGACK